VLKCGETFDDFLEFFKVDAASEREGAQGRGACEKVQDIRLEVVTRMSTSDKRSLPLPFVNAGMQIGRQRRKRTE
jgi:hypothetical protein